MKPYLFLWNPKKDKGSFRDYELIQSDAADGHPYCTEWRCPSKQPRKGDVAVLQRTGNRNNGIFALGKVTKPPFMKKKIRWVELQLTQFMPLGKEIPRKEIITTARYKEKWMPMASGNFIPEPLYQAIVNLWQRRETDAKKLATLNAPQVGSGFGLSAQNHLVENAAIQQAICHYQRLRYTVESVEADKCG